ncbi:hypothetical protein Egran_02658 [Elaphomyces granulatus]|uniref:Trehalase n=1 Tax=Elaphomyces granulatus TaxID=519963 RepID=A0A232LZI5_9EURO|nr:hypothetical protein Egran_02658 [Elaphomyces granulatus]
MEFKGQTPIQPLQPHGEALDGILRKTASIPAIRKQFYTPLKRRGSHDEIKPANIVFKLYVTETLQLLLQQEDTDNNVQITVLDNGPKVMSLGTATSDSVKRREVRGTYQLANLLEKLYLTDGARGLDFVCLDEISENPVNRIDRKIRNQYWTTLTRRLDDSMIEAAAVDPKDWNDNPRPRIYVPFGLQRQFDYYSQLARDRPHLNLDVQYLPRGEEITQEFVHGIRDRPGILALEMEYSPNTEVPSVQTMRGMEFIVPGGRFNECYYWDSYFICIGLLEIGRTDIVKQIIKNFIFEIQNYGRIPNANRSYFLCRSQPPFFSDLIVRTFKAIESETGAVEFLRTAILAAIKEYRQVWMAEPRYDPVSGLSRYRSTGIGIPLEVEPGHFDYILSGYAEKYSMTISEFTVQYNDGKIKEPALDEFFLHDKAVRESGHDTSYRFEEGAANLATVDLNCLLYKYETDIAWAIKNVFNDRLVICDPWCTPGVTEGHVETSSHWNLEAQRRQARANTYLWNADQNMFFDYNTATNKQSTYEYVTTFYALWCGLATPAQAELLVSKSLPKFECVGGLTTSTESSRGPIGPGRVWRQWDYPFGWAPHQMLAWDGLKKYGYDQDMERLVYRWLHILVRVAVDYNGAIVEKYDVTQLKNPCKVDAEYGNQGLDFKGANVEGFGWSNASFSYGLSKIKHNGLMMKALGLLVPYDDLKWKK